MNMKTDTDNSKFSRILAYGFAQFSDILSYQTFSIYIFTFYFAIVGLEVPHITIGFIIWSLWNSINDPLLGYVSDRTRTRWGRRRPYLLFGALPLAVTFTMLWYRPGFESPSALIAYYSVAYIIFEASATLLYMPYFALTPELTSDYDERTSLTTYSTLSLLISIISPG